MIHDQHKKLSQNLCQKMHLHFFINMYTNNNQFNNYAIYDFNINCNFFRSKCYVDCGDSVTDTHT